VLEFCYYTCCDPVSKAAGWTWAYNQKKRICISFQPLATLFHAFPCTESNSPISSLTNGYPQIDRESDQYTIGWIAALPIERAAAIAMLDEKHEKPKDFIQPRTDTNLYTWGRIAEHNVVIVSLPAGIYGTVSAATTAVAMLSSFLKFGLALCWYRSR
jgi:hypothetical protein